jgi:hypothetical protein
LGQRAAVRGEWLVYRIAGLPIAFAAALRVSGDGPVDQLRRAYAAYYWQPTNAADAAELVAALLLWPVCLLVGAVWFTLRNGETIARRCGKTAARQFVEQLAAYFTAGCYRHGTTSSSCITAAAPAARAVSCTVARPSEVCSGC